MKKYFSLLTSPPAIAWRRSNWRAGHFSSRKGFTLIELLVAIGIIGILSSFLLANFVGVRQRARDGVRKSDLRQIQSALELYRSDQGNYPITPGFTLSCGCALTSKGIDCGTSPSGTIYMQKIPCDPLGPSAYYIDPYGNPTYLFDSPNGRTYTLIACIENANDNDKNVKGMGLCFRGSSSTRKGFWVYNP